MTQQELDALRALADAATPGPWRLCDGGIRLEMPGLGSWWAPIIDAGEHSTDICYMVGEKHDHVLNVDADAAFIAAARAAAPALLAEVERLNCRNNELAEQLRLANEREAAARVECGRLNGQAAGKVKELLAEVERLRADNAQLQQQRHAAREDAYRLGVEEGLSLSRGISNERDALRAELALRDRYNEYVRVTQALRTSEVLPFDEWNRGDVPPLRPDAPRLRRPTKD